MVITYNKRKQGTEYLKTAFGTVIKKVLASAQPLDLNPLSVVGRMSQLKLKNPPTNPKDALAIPEVRQEVEMNTAQLKRTCEEFMNVITGSLASMPYGLRLISKQIRNICLNIFPETTVEEIHKTLGYFVFYRFIALAIMSPGSCLRISAIIM
jgi:hypothetical protein